VRADAERNLRRILDSARELVALHGADVSVEMIARSAGVGVGTIYRRFPDRLALLHAVLLDRVAAINALLDELEPAQADDPAAAWEAFLDGFLASGLALLLPSLAPLAQQADVFVPEIVAVRDHTVRRVDAFYQEAQRAGIVRTDLGLPEVVLLLASVLRQLPGLPDAFQQHLTARRVALVRQALAPGSPALPGRPTSVPELLAVAAPPPAAPA